jgi:hypothetical protein
MSQTTFSDLRQSRVCDRDQPVRSRRDASDMDQAVGANLWRDKPRQKSRFLRRVLSVVRNLRHDIDSFSLSFPLLPEPNPGPLILAKIDHGRAAAFARDATK